MNIPSYSILNKSAMDGTTIDGVVAALVAKAVNDSVSTLTALTDANAAPATTGVRPIPAFAAADEVSDGTRATVATINGAVTVIEDGVAELEDRADEIMTRIGGEPIFVNAVTTNGAWANVFGTPIASAGTAVASTAAYQTFVGELNNLIDTVALGVNKTLSALGEDILDVTIIPEDKTGDGTVTDLVGGTAAGPSAAKVTADLTIAVSNLSNMLDALNAATTAKTLDAFIILK
jgi:hypothetical protein